MLLFTLTTSLFVVLKGQANLMMRYFGVDLNRKTLLACRENWENEADKKKQQLSGNYE